MASAGAGRRRGADPPLCGWLFPRAMRMEGDAQVRGESRRLSPRPCAGMLGWAVSAALGLGNFWPNVPAPVIPSRPAAPQAQRVKQVPRPARRYWPRAGAAVPRPPRSARSTWVRAPGASATGPLAAGPGPRRARGKEDRTRWGNLKQHQKSRSGVGARRRNGTCTPQRAGAAPSARQLQSRLKIGKKEEGSGTTGVLGRGWGKPSTLTAPTY